MGRHSDVGLDDGQGCRWKITRALGDMTVDHGFIKSQTSTEVVTEPGLTWAYFDRGKWRSAKIKVSIPPPQPLINNILPILLPSTTILILTLTTLTLALHHHPHTKVSIPKKQRSKIFTRPSSISDGANNDDNEASSRMSDMWTDVEDGASETSRPSLAYAAWFEEDDYLRNNLYVLFCFKFF